MMKFYWTVLFLSSPVFAFGQLPYQLGVVGNWDRDGLPIIDNQSFSDIWAWVDSTGREYAIMGSLDSIYFIEITDPSNPVLRDVKPGKARNCIHRDFKTYQHYCYAVADEGSSSLQIFDMQYLPDSVHRVYDDDTYSLRTHNIFIAKEKLYLATNQTWSGYVPLRILSLADPENPQPVTVLRAPFVDGSPLFDEVHDVHVRNDTLYCSAGSSGMLIYYLQDSAVTQSQDGSDSSYFDPTLTLVRGKMRYADKGFNHSSWISANGRYLVFSDETHGTSIKLMDLGAKQGLDIVSTFGYNVEAGSVVHNCFIKDDKVYVAYYHEGVQVFDIANPSSPQHIAGYDTYPQNSGYQGLQGCWGVYPFLPSGNIIASDQLNGLFVFDLKVGMQESPKPASTVSLYPNPVGQAPACAIVFSDEHLHSAIEIEVFTTTGQSIWQGHFFLHNNTVNLPIEKNWPSGPLLCRIRIPAENQVLVKQLVR